MQTSSLELFSVHTFPDLQVGYAGGVLDGRTSWLRGETLATVGDAQEAGADHHPRSLGEYVSSKCVGRVKEFLIGPQSV